MNSRRDLLKSAVGLLGLSLVLPTWARAEEKRRARPGDAAAGGDLPLVKPGEGTAKALNYHDDKAKITDAKLKTERVGVAWDKQHCSNCMLYTAKGKKGSDEVGACQLFANQLVKGQGWCSSWSKKG